MLFEYKAYNEKMEIFQGKIRSDCLNEAKEELHKKNYRLIEIYESKNKVDILKYRFHFSYDDLSCLFAEMSLMLKGGIDLVAVLDLIIKGYNGRKKKIFIEIKKDIISGKFLSLALEQTGSFPLIVIGMIHVAETSGSLPETLSSLSQFYKEEDKLKRKISNALAYPILLGLVSLIVSHIILNFVFPIFMDIFTSSNLDLPWSTKLLLFSSNHAARYGVYYFLALLLIISLIFFGFFIPKIRYQMDKSIINSPIIGSIYRKRFELFFINAMLIQIKTGVEILKVIENSKKLTNNLFLKEKFNNVEDKLRLGKPLARALEEEIPFSEKTILLLSLGEDSSSLTETLEILSNILHESYEGKIDKLNIYLEPIIIIVMSIFVGFIVFSIAIPMFDLVNQI